MLCKYRKSLNLNFAPFLLPCQQLLRQLFQLYIFYFFFFFAGVALRKTRELKHTETKYWMVELGENVTIPPLCLFVFFLNVTNSGKS